MDCAWRPRCVLRPLGNHTPWWEIRAAAVSAVPPPLVGGRRQPAHPEVGGGHGVGRKECLHGQPTGGTPLCVAGERAVRSDHAFDSGSGAVGRADRRDLGAGDFRRQGGVGLRIRSVGACAASLRAAGVDAVPGPWSAGCFDRRDVAGLYASRIGHRCGIAALQHPDVQGRLDAVVAGGSGSRGAPCRLTFWPGSGRAGDGGWFCPGPSLCGTPA